METQANMITIEATVNAPIDKVWGYWNTPEHVTKWNQASDDWHSPSGTNDLKIGGSFSYRMEAKDGSFGFDFGGTYTQVKTNDEIAYTMGDGRKVKVTFTSMGNQTKVVEMFEPEKQNSEEMQRTGWQAIMDNFKKYTESH